MMNNTHTNIQWESGGFMGISITFSILGNKNCDHLLFMDILHLVQWEYDNSGGVQSDVWLIKLPISTI